MTFLQDLKFLMLTRQELNGYCPEFCKGDECVMTEPLYFIESAPIFYFIFISMLLEVLLSIVTIVIGSIVVFNKK